MTVRQIVLGIAYVMLCGIGATYWVRHDPPTAHHIGDWTFTCPLGTVHLFLAGCIGGLVLLIVDGYVRRRFRLGSIFQVDERVE
jgi:hypothetical protein